MSAKITLNHKSYIINWLQNNFVDNQPQGQQLESPEYIGTSDTNYVADLKSKQPLATNIVINNIISSTNNIVVYVNYEILGFPGGAILFYDSLDNLYNVLLQYESSPGVINYFPKFLTGQLDVPTDRLYGLVEINGKTNFFVLNDILDRAIFDIDDLTSETFFTTLFDIETTQITDDGIVGNSVFSEFRTNPNIKYSVSLNSSDNNEASFLVFSEVSKLLIICRFKSDLRITSSGDADWLNNEVVGFSNNIDNLVIDNISTLGIQVGLEQSINGESTFGTAIVSTETSSSGLVEKTFSSKTEPNTYNTSLWNDITNGNRFTGTNNLPYLNVPYDNNFVDRVYLSSNEINRLKESVKKIVDSNPNSFEFDFEADGFIFNNLSTADWNEILKNDYELVINGFEHTFLQQNQIISVSRIRYSLISQLAVKYSLRKVGTTNDYIATAIRATQSTTNTYETSLGTTPPTQSVAIQPASSKLWSNMGEMQWTNGLNNLFTTMNWSPANQTIAPRINNGIAYARLTLLGNIGSAKSSVNSHIYISGSFKRDVQVIGRNTSFSFLIKEDEDGNNKYVIDKAENNSFNGNQSSFINSNNAIIPLKNFQTNNYDLYSFNSINSSTSQITRTFDDVSTQTYTDTGVDVYSAPLLAPNLIAYVLVNGVYTSSVNWTLSSTGTLEIKGIKLNDVIEIEYLTNIQKPEIIEIDLPESVGDLKIATIDNTKELGIATNTFVGFITEDTIYNTKTNFNLYSPTQNQTETRISSEAIPYDFEVNKVIAYRQKDIFWSRAYNDDYTRYSLFKQIYPSSLKPYTLQFYFNNDKALKVERFNISMDDYRGKSVFDREIVDANASGSSYLATTYAETTDLNDPNNNMLNVYGQTNDRLFYELRNFSKNPNERKQINFNVDMSFIDNINNINTSRPNIAEKLVKLYEPTSTTLIDNFKIKTIQIFYDDGTSQTTEDIVKYSKQVIFLNQYGELDLKLRFEFSILDNNRKPVRLLALNGYGDTITDATIDTASCVGTGLYNIAFDIIITDNQAPFNSFFKWDETKWDVLPWEVITPVQREFLANYVRAKKEIKNE